MHHHIPQKCDGKPHTFAASVWTLSVKCFISSHVSSNRAMSSAKSRYVSFFPSVHFNPKVFSPIALDMIQSTTIAKIKRQQHATLSYSGHHPEPLTQLPRISLHNDCPCVWCFWLNWRSDDFRCPCQNGIGNRRS